MTVWWDIVHGLKYQKFTTSGCKDVKISNSEFRECNQFFRRSFWKKGRNIGQDDLKVC